MKNTIVALLRSTLCLVTAAFRRTSAVKSGLQPFFGLFLSVAFMGEAIAGGSNAPINCDGPGPDNDLQTAISDANPGDTIKVKGRCQGNFTIDKDLTIKGVSGAVLDAGGFPGAGTVVSIGVGSTVTLKTLTVTGGYDTIGTITFGATIAVGGIFNQGDLTLWNVEVVDNLAAPNQLAPDNPFFNFLFGISGIWTDGAPGSKLTMKLTNVSRNKTEFVATDLGFDDGAFVVPAGATVWFSNPVSTFEMVNSDIQDNETLVTAILPRRTGLRVPIAYTLRIDAAWSSIGNSTIANNKATVVGSGGRVVASTLEWNSGGAPNSGAFEISLLFGNTIKATAPSDSQNDQIIASTIRSEHALDVRNAYISSNSVEAEGPGAVEVTADGGIHCSINCELDVTNSLVFDNQATILGGPSPTQNATGGISANNLPDFGDGSTVMLKNTTVENNVANSPRHAVGGLADYLDPFSDAFTLINSVINDNDPLNCNFEDPGCK